VTRNREDFSDLCISREKLIYGVIPKDSNILECLSINERGLEFPYYRLGSLRDFMQRNQQHISDKTRDQWVMSAVDSIILIHKYGVIHAYISPRNFLVAQDLSIQLCDFSGSAIGDLEALVQEEDRYRLFPWSPRSVQTDLFALGCLIFEISTGVRPYDDIDDQNYEEIGRRYTARSFPSLDGNPYRDATLKCWTLQYTSVDDLRSELRQFSKETQGSREHGR